ncbi:MAG: GGDEF domain-containing protein [Gammaproteobacteria bacterium]|nr:GGDEF domain-containing protein [Gammaproteobacteria bacterium]MDH3768366.1 GGDEF domain-containing protein [Gammaproteobacteria bacterium]
MDTLASEQEGASACQLLDNPEVLSDLRLFRSVSPHTMALYLDECGVKTIAPNELLLSPDRPNLHFYVVLSGTLQIHLDSVDQQALTTLSKGDCVGEMSILESKNPSAYVMAVKETTLLMIPHDTLWAMINVSHAIARNLLVILSQRVRCDNRIIADSVVIMRQYERKSVTDALTGLYNRHWMEDMFRRELRRCRIGDKPVCLIMIDVDGFKTYNNEYGHLVGDHALCCVADALRDHFRPTDLIARFGGDEFSVMLPDTTFENALMVAERVRKGVSISRGAEIESDASPVTVSLGVAEADPADSLETLIERADAALYRSKLRGRNRVSR